MQAAVAKPELAEAGRAANEELLDGGAVVEGTLRTARRFVGLAVAAVALVLVLVGVERAWFVQAERRATERMHHAQQIEAVILLHDERLTMSAWMAAATGEERWIARYHESLPALEAALADGASLAPTEVARRFNERTREATERLVELETTALEATVRAPELARAILDSERYRRDRQLLVHSTRDFAQSIVAAMREERAAVQRRAQAVLSVTLALALAVGSLTWLHLRRNLARSRAVLVRAQQRVQRLATSDNLTGLPNRAALHDAMAAAAARARRSGARLALLMIDLDRFKPINDTHGHHVGDHVLREAAQRMQRVLRTGELLARFGGDEFVALIDEPPQGGEAWRLATWLIEALSTPIECGSLVVQIGASVGIARFPDDTTDIDDLLRRADLALYRAKSSGRGHACHYDAALDNAHAERQAMEQRLRDAIAAGDVKPHYQPVVDLADRRVLGVELLSRWHDGERGWIPPSEFIPVAEACGLIGDLTLSVLRQACADLRRMPPRWRVAVNVAPAQIQDPRLVDELIQVLRSTGTDPHRLEIELTETALVADFQAARRTIDALKGHGITVALDDFGTGYSSLSTLSQLRFDKIKIDRSFVATLAERSESVKIVSSILGLGVSLGVQVVAEGVETEREAKTLAGLGCGIAQGFLFGRPAALDDLVSGHAPRNALAA